jgi:NAD(P)-dependent dehydrogenase (short-subunit alcohol dehydrogenase family)
VTQPHALGASGKTILVTGSTSGIGLETAKELGRLGARVIVHGRDDGKVHRAAVEVERAIAELDPPSQAGTVEEVVADLSSQRQIRELAREIGRRFERLDVLVNNAGVFMVRRAVTEDGVEMTLAVNHLAPFLLTNELADLLHASAPSRVVNVASVAHFGARPDLGDPNGERHYDPYNAYNTSKLGLIVFTYELAKRLTDWGVTANCLHPGVIATKLLNQGFPGMRADSPAEGARTSVYLAASPDVQDVTGRYFDQMRLARSSEASYDRDLRRRFWELSEILTGAHQIVG